MSAGDNKSIKNTQHAKSYIMLVRITMATRQDLDQSVTLTAAQFENQASDVCMA